MKRNHPMEFLKYTELEDYVERNGDKCVGVFQYRIYEDEDGIYSMHDCMWSSPSEYDSMFRELQMLCEVSSSVTDQVIAAVDPEQNEFDDLDEAKNQTLQ